jgi:hypothetical protein
MSLLHLPKPSGVVSGRSLFEKLEGRMLLCGTVQELIAAGVPASIIHDDGHISRADYQNLSPKLQAHVDPHFLEETYDAPIDYDKILGVPTDPTGRGAPEADTFPDWFPAVNGSITLDQTSQPGRTLVKFPTAINNQGSGPGIGISGRPGVDPIPTGAPITSWLTPDGGQAVLQPIYSYNAATNSFTLDHYRAGGSFTYHPGHAHFHFDGYNYYRLRYNNGGTPGDYVVRSDGTSIIGEKVGFCLINVGSSFTTEGGQSSTLLPGYSASGQPSTGCGFVQGVHVGKYDQYGSGTSGQLLDVTGVPNGNYFLEITVDGENVLQETNETNNAKLFPFTLNVNPPVGGITPDQFDSGGNHNDTIDTATDMGVMGTFAQTGLTIHWGQDYDFFEFTASSSGPGTVTATQASGDVNIYLYDSNHQGLGASSNASGSESISFNFVAGQSYYVEARTYNSGTSSNYQIGWNLKPTVGAIGTDTIANEIGPNFGTIALGRNGPVNAPLTVNFTVGGDATRGVDYQIFFDTFEVTGNSVNIGSANSQAVLEIRPIHDATPEAPETVTITLDTSSAYAVGNNAAASVVIGDAGPEVSNTTQIWQTAPHKLVFDIDRALASTIQLSDFAVLNLNTNQTVAAQSIATQDLGSSVRATLTFNGVLPDARYRVTVAPGAFANSSGDPNFGQFTYDFFVLTADANHDGRVDLLDFNILSQNFGQTGRDGTTGDFDYDGDADLADFNLLSARFGTTAGPASSLNATATFNTGRRIGDTTRDLLDQLE